MYKPNPTPTFKRDVKRLAKKHYPIDSLKTVIDLLLSGSNQEILRTQYADHLLSGNSEWRGHHELHVDSSYNNDWLLIYRIEKSELILELIRSGSHKELLGK
ncbi:type II toxin-antitoxin system YafQ family toxin [Lacticaseibacillus hulanensis]|uniref:type II toxin-antitoxin system YafQ family toxin n=1 Tax=Lacticaseibacillus hulanensis TaxID=2493111 RepID=UPI000FDA4C80|nr:type II toxin-antitoxin system YafQ family toxin [Lacticaseibacillus hulanensis]